MIRKTLTILSLVVLVLSVAAWGASYWGWAAGDVLFIIESEAGCIVIHYDQGVLDPEEDWHFMWILFEDMDFKTRWKPDWMWYDDPEGLMWQLVLPLWIPALSFALLSCWLYLPLRRRRKRKNLGLCLKCGYDLRGSSERCPECGTAIEQQVKQP